MAARHREWTNAIRRAIARRAEGTASLERGLEHLANRLVQLAIDGDQFALKEIGDRLEGKPTQGVVLSGDEEGGPVRVAGLAPIYGLQPPAEP